MIKIDSHSNRKRKIKKLLYVLIIWTRVQRHLVYMSMLNMYRVPSRHSYFIKKKKMSASVRKKCNVVVDSSLQVRVVFTSLLRISKSYINFSNNFHNSIIY